MKICQTSNGCQSQQKSIGDKQSILLQEVELNDNNEGVLNGAPNVQESL